MDREREHHLDEDLCLDLVLGRLPAQEAERWAEHLQRCPACEEEVRARSAELETRRAGPLPRRDADGRLSLPPGTRTVRAARRSRLPWAAAVAVVVAAVVAVFLLGRGPGTVQAPPAVFWIDRDLEQIAPRSGGSTGDALQEGLRAYADHDAARAAELLEAARVEGGLDEIRRLYLANALLHLDRGDESASLLRALEPRTLPAPWRDDALWTLHAALVQSGRAAAADSLLEEMAALPGATGQRAREMRGK